MNKTNPNVDKYYFEQDNGKCKEKCLIKKETMIGSLKCQCCKHCIDYDKDLHNDTNWIKCEKISLATSPTKENKPNNDE